MILAIDPGRDKTGIAVVTSGGGVEIKKIISTDCVDSYLQRLMNNYNIESIVIGNGTTSDRFVKRLEELDLQISIELVDEAYSTREAEKRYRAEHPLRGWKRFLKLVEWKPDRPVDDYVAVILAERYLESNG